MINTSRRLLFLSATIAAIAIVGLAVAWWRNHVFDEVATELTDGNYTRAKERLKTLGNLGDSKAQALLGDLYAFGWGVPKNDQEAISWYRRAGADGEDARDPAAPAMYYVGLKYWKGEGVARSDAEARKWFERAAQGGYAKATEVLAQMATKEH